jgi:protein SCO1/2
MSSSNSQKRRSARRWALLGAAALVLCGAALPLAAQGGQQHHQHHPPPEPTGAVSLGSMNIPDATLRDQDGREVRFYSDLVEGRVVAMNFIFTTCTTICPPMGANFSKLQQLMGDRAGRDFEMISVSVDPAVDTPARLKAWAAKFGRREGWTLVTGRKSEVDALLKALKVFTADKNDHSPILLVGDDARDEWTRAYGLAPPAKVAEMIDELLAASAGAGAAEGS